MKRYLSGKKKFMIRPNALGWVHRQRKKLARIVRDAITKINPYIPSRNKTFMFMALTLVGIYAVIKSLKAEAGLEKVVEKFNNNVSILICQKSITPQRFKILIKAHITSLNNTIAALKWQLPFNKPDISVAEKLADELNEQEKLLRPKNRQNMPRHA